MGERTFIITRPRPLLSTPHFSPVLGMVTGSGGVGMGIVVLVHCAVMASAQIPATANELLDPVVCYDQMVELGCGSVEKNIPVGDLP